MKPDESFSTLTPDLILNALESVGLRGDGRLLALNSYENRVYQVGMEDGPPLVAKFYRPGRWTDAAILEEHTFVQTLVEAEIPVVPAMALLRGQTLIRGQTPALRGLTPNEGLTLHTFEGHRFAVFEKRGGRAPELDNEHTLEWMGRFIGRIHALGATQPYAHRPALTIETFGTVPRDYLLDHHFLPDDIEPAYRAAVEQALVSVHHCMERAGSVATLRLHGDCHPGNVLWTPDGPHFVDFDDSRMGPAVQDLWMLLAGERVDRTRQMGALLAGYECFYDFNPRELHLIEALRTLRLIHYAAWIARRWQDPAFPIAFPWFNTQRYWQDRVLELREQIALMDEPPLWSS